MKLFGTYYGSYLEDRRTLRGAGCSDAGRIYFWADNEQRTLETARGLAEGMFPGCQTAIHSLPEDEADPLFQGLASKAGGRLRTASTLTENLLLEYTQGIAGKALGWGRLDASSLPRIMALHTAYADLARRTPYVARVRGSNLLDHILNSLRQSVRKERIGTALGKPGDAALVIVGHDTNLSNLSGMLGISWLLPGYQPNDPAPGGALVFELWRSADGKRHSVRMYYTAQSLEQMRTQALLKLTAPPEKAEIFLPGCGTASAGFACDWTDFERTVSAAIDPAFVEK